MSLNNKYRPIIFEEVIGQDETIKILKKEIESSSIAPAYLFVGGSGMGKTTLARIFANNVDAEILEIDAASNNSAESMRNLLESIKTKPIIKSRYCVIIDEAHALSSAAVQTLLYPLENYSSFKMFILCTTEVNKIPKTIYNRCEVFNFSPVSKDDIISRIYYICKSERYEFEYDALEIIASLAQGSVRQAITYLDKIKPLITIQNVKDCICAGDIDTYFNLFYSICDVNYESICKICDNAKEGNRFVQEFYTFILDINIYCKTKDISLTTLPSIYEEQLQKLTNKDKLVANNLIEKLYELQFFGRNNPIIIQLLKGMCYILCK